MIINQITDIYTLNFKKVYVFSRVTVLLKQFPKKLHNLYNCINQFIYFFEKLTHS